MRILFLSHRYSDTEVGGLAEFLHFLPIALSIQGINSLLYTASKNEKASQFQEAVVCANKMQHFSGPFLKPRFFLDKSPLDVLSALCQNQQVDVIHAQGTYRAGLMAMHLKKHTGLPYIVTSHSDILGDNSGRAKRKSFQKRCQAVLKQADYVTHLSPLMQQVSDDIYPTTNKSCIIHNGIDLNLWPKKSEETHFLLSIGRLEPEKGFGLLLDVYAKLCHIGVDIPLVIAGSGSAEESLFVQAKHLGLNILRGMQDFSNLGTKTVVFTGYVRGADKVHLFQQARMVLFATQPDQWQESFGIVQLEAMAAAKAIVASDMPSTRYLSSLGMQGILVTANNQDEWVSAISQLLREPTLRETAELQNHAAAQHFSWTKIASEYAKVYQNIKNSR